MVASARVCWLGLCLAGCHSTTATDAAAPDRPAAPVEDVSAPDVPAPTDVPAVVDAAPAARRVVVTLTGDIYLHRAVLHAFDSHEEQGGVVWTLNWLASLITPREVALGWLDAPLTDAHRPLFTTGAQGIPAAQARGFARGLARVGLDGICMATQHAYDQMGDGLGETNDTLRHASIGVAGAGDSEESAWAPWVAEREGIRVAYLCFTQRVLMGAGSNAAHATVAMALDGTRAIAAVTAARARADVVVAGVQWNRAPFRALSAEQRQLARQLVDAGADVVVGSGALTQSPIERVSSPRGDAVIAWSIGSLLSNYGERWRGAHTPPPEGLDRTQWDAATRDVALVRAQFELLDGARLSLVTLTANALWTQHGPEGLRVVPLRTLNDYDLRVARSRAVAAALGPAVRVRE